jgi:surface polysaccharide O-acyltransferase-like enzyme
MSETPSVNIPEKESVALMNWADRLRNIATLMVIAIHLAAPIAFEYPDLNTSWWWTGNIINSMTRPGVPLFVMLSGFLLLSKDYDLIDFLKRRFSRVIIPALFWMSYYLYNNHFINNKPASLKEGLLELVSGPVHYHMWFIYLIIGLYLIYPILRPWVRQASERDLIYFLLLCMFATWFYKPLYHFTGQQIGVYFELLSNNCGHFVLGYYLGQKTCRTSHTGSLSSWPCSDRQLGFIGLGLVLFGTMATSLASYWLNIGRGDDVKFDVIFYDYLMPNVGIGAIGWFLLAKQWMNNPPLKAFEVAFAAASFGIYFVHVRILDWWAYLGFWHSRWHPIKGLPILIIQVTLISFIVVALIRSLPGGKKIT